MRRAFIPIKNIFFFEEENPFLNNPLLWMHRPTVDSMTADFYVDADKDGQTTEQHREGIEYIKGVFGEGQKIRPILVLEDPDVDAFYLLDGFKRAWALKELEEENVEAFIVTEKEFRDAVFFPYGDSQIRAWYGGMPKEEYGLFEGDEKAEFNYENVKFLFKSPNGAGLRIELCENIHVHWGEVGRYRLDLGRKDFEALAEAISKI